VSVAFVPQPEPVVPLYSRNGTLWKRVPASAAGAAPAPGAQASYTRGADGAVTVRTTIAGTFALVPDRTKPSPPPGVAGRFVGGNLLLSWHAATDSNGPIAGYRVTLTNIPVADLPAGRHRDAVSGFRPNAPSVYRIVSVDAAGNVSGPSKPVVVLPAPRPDGIPKALPRWAWRLFDWQRHGRTTPRPHAPRIVPDWYWRWSAWRAFPFRLRSS
jgi:hypothetical protein